MSLVGVMLWVAITSAVAKSIEELRARWTGRCSLLGETMTAIRRCNRKEGLERLPSCQMKSAGGGERPDVTIN